MLNIYIIQKPYKEGIAETIIDATGVEHYPHYCIDCGEGIWEGHVLECVSDTFCESCFDKQYDAIQRQQMYDEDEQYWTQWDESDFDPGTYNVIGPILIPEDGKTFWDVESEVS